MRPTTVPIWQILIIFVVAPLQSLIECKSFFGIGTRIHNDQLLLKDIQQARLVGVDKGQEVGFNYAIPEPITYIEIVSEQVRSHFGHPLYEYITSKYIHICIYVVRLCVCVYVYE